LVANSPEFVIVVLDDADIKLIPYELDSVESHFTKESETFQILENNLELRFPKGAITADIF
jgi:hypothetical protein